MSRDYAWKMIAIPGLGMVIAEVAWSGPKLLARKVTQVAWLQAPEEIAAKGRPGDVKLTRHWLGYVSDGELSINADEVFWSLEPSEGLVKLARKVWGEKVVEVATGNLPANGPVGIVR